MINLNTFYSLAKMALRNLARHKVKTLLTSAAVMVSVALFIFQRSLLLGMGLDSRRNIVNYETGAAKLQTALYFQNKDDLPSYENFAGWESYAAALEAAGYDSAPRYVFSGTLYSTSGSAPILFNAVDPALDARLLRCADWIETGRYLESGKFEIVLGAMAADKLKVGIPSRLLNEELEDEILPLAADSEERGFIASLYEKPALKRQFFQPEEDYARQTGRLRLRLDAPPADLSRYWAILARSGRNDVRISTVIDIKEGKAVRHVNQLIDAVVVGIVNSPDPATNTNIAYIPLDALQDEAGMMLEGHITELLIRQKNAKDAALPGAFESPKAITSALAAAGGAASGGGILPSGKPDALEVHGYLEYADELLGAEKMENVEVVALTGLLFVLSFLAISGTMLMAILERTKETGMMRAMGMTDGGVIAVYVLEAGFLGLTGSLAGIILGCLINLPMVEYGMNMSSMNEAMGGDWGYRIAAVMRSTWDAGLIAGTGIAATALSALVSIPPISRAVKMEITQSLRFE